MLVKSSDGDRNGRTLMHRFYWLVENLLAGSSRPGARGRLDDDLDFLSMQGIGAILSLTETPLDEWLLQERDLASLHIPIVDLTAPYHHQFMDALSFIDAHVNEGRPVVVHCLAGQGRTGSILGAYLIRDGLGADDAIAQLRTICPGAVENDDQVAALHEFARRQSWLV
ncbi:dual specificity protein phosphatase family protein [soil metagenome]